MRDGSTTLPAGPVPSPVRRAGSHVCAAFAVLLLLTGFVNWTIVGLLGLNPLATMFGAMSTPSRIACTVLVAAAVVWVARLSRLSRP